MSTEPKNKTPFQVAIDGGAASGKSSTSRELSYRYPLLHIDTGRHYRALTARCLDEGIQPEDQVAIEALKEKLQLDTKVQGAQGKILLDGQLIDDSRLRSPEVNDTVSAFAAVPEIRQIVRHYQQSLPQVAVEKGFSGTIMEGRDIGSVILPDAQLKLFLEADPTTREQRRAAEGEKDQITRRDQIDSQRKVAPLKPADDAVRLDTGRYNLLQVVDHAGRLIERRGLKPVLYQRWRDLLFLHWPVDPDFLAGELPPGLTPDLHEGKAWVGIVPFRMEGVHPRGLPTVPGLSAFPELNLRTYVRGPDGVPGVWFFSLDAGHAIPVWIARTFFHLPYFTADMTCSTSAESGEIQYYSRHRNEPAQQFRYRPAGEPAYAEPGTLDHFLVERYRLYAWDRDRRRLFAGRVCHAPYTIQPVEVGGYSTDLFARAHFAQPTTPPAHATYAPGVDVTIFPLERIG